MIRHATLVAGRVGSDWRGALLEGPSGAGKSDLALRAMEARLRLVADDRVILWACEGALFGRAPDALAGLLEVRGQGILRMPALPICRIDLLVRLETPERMPDLRTERMLEVELPVVSINPLEGSAPAKLRRALDLFDAAHNRRM